MTNKGRFLRLVVILAGIASLWASAARAQTQLDLARLHIKHVIVVMQENRSFDQSFGTYPGADGIPPGTCVPNWPGNPAKGCTVPFHNKLLINAGGPHTATDYEADVDKGRMDGFIFQQLAGSKGCPDPSLQTCNPKLAGVKIKDVVGYHDGTDIPNYWT